MVGALPNVTIRLLPTTVHAGCCAPAVPKRVMFELGKTDVHGTVPAMVKDRLPNVTKMELPSSASLARRGAITHTSWPVAAGYMVPTQGWQTDTPVPLEKVEGGQGMGAGVLSVQKVPGGHTVHAVDPENAYMPARHVVQLVTATAPMVLGLMVPPGQPLHTDRPVTSL